MSIGTEVSPHLPFLRRYLRALFGSQEVGDELMRRTLAAIVSNPKAIGRTVDLRVGLHRLIYSLISDEERKPRRTNVPEDAEGIAHRRLQAMTFESRVALLLTSLEGLSSEDAAFVLDVDRQQVDSLVAIALEEVERQTHAKILIIEDEPIVAMDLETIARDLGHDVVYVAVTRAEAVEAARREKPTLILVDIELADGSSGIDAIRDIRNELTVPVIFITAFPERLLVPDRPEPAFLITKPFQRSTVKAGIAQALFFDAATVPSHEEPIDRFPVLDEKAVRARAGPVDARVSRGQLRLVDTTRAPSNTEISSIEAVRKLHLRTAKALMQSIAGSNAAPRLHRRLDGIRRTLSRALTQERALQLAIQARGFEGMLSSVVDVLDDATLADLNIFALDLTDLLRQFPSYRQFLDEAAKAETISNDAREAAARVADAFIDEDDKLVHPDLKKAVVEVRESSEERIDPVSDLALVRTAGNLLRAIGRFLNTHATAVLRQSGATFDNVGGRVVGIVLVTTIIGGPMLAALLVLQRALPTEFGFVGPLVRLAKLLLGS